MCQTGICSKVRCRLYGFVSGRKATIVEKTASGCGCGGSRDSCKEGTFCQVTDKYRRNQLRDFGNDFSTLGAYIGLLTRVVKARVFGGDVPTKLKLKGQ